MEIEAMLPGFAVWCMAGDLDDIADGASAAEIEKRMHELRSDFERTVAKFLDGKATSKSRIISHF